MTDRLTASEQTLVHSMAIAASAKAGAYCRDFGYAPPSAEQLVQMSRMWINAFTTFVKAYDPAGADWDNDALAGVVEGAAEGAVARVLGEPPIVS